MSAITTINVVSQYSILRRKSQTLTIFIDLKKAFDTVDNNILFKRIMGLGVFLTDGLKKS